MAPRGRPPKSKAQHKRDGTFVPSRHANRLDDSAFAGELPPCPLTGTAAELWAQVVKASPEGQLRAIDESHLAGLCKWGSEYERINDALRDVDPVDPAHYRLLCAAAMAWKHFAAASSRFGMTPVDRARLKAPAVEQKEDDPLSALALYGAKHA